MDSALSPGSSLAFLVAAEEALAVFSVQALVKTGVIEFLPVHGVVESDDCRRRSHIQH